MKVYVAQIYIEPAISFPFTHHFQKYISQRLTDLIQPSPSFIAKFGEDFDLIFRMSAKAALVEPEIQGPTVCKRDKDVEYTIFLPFGKPAVVDGPSSEASLFHLLTAIISVLLDLEINVARLQHESREIVAAIMREPRMTGLTC